MFVLVQSMLIVDVSDLSGYPHADCSQQNKVELHNKPFGDGQPIYLYFSDAVTHLTDSLAREYSLKYPTRSQIMCVVDRQWNVVNVLPENVLVRFSCSSCSCNPSL